MSKLENRPRVLRVLGSEFSREVYPGVACMKHTFGQRLSVALFKVEKGKGSAFPSIPHSHGEEVAIQLRGSSRVEADGVVYEVKEGDMIIVPEGLVHSGVFTDDEESWLLAIASPPRDDYGPPDWEERG